MLGLRMSNYFPSWQGDTLRVLGVLLTYVGSLEIDAYPTRFRFTVYVVGTKRRRGNVPRTKIT